MQETENNDTPTRFRSITLRIYWKMGLLAVGFAGEWNLRALAETLRRPIPTRVRRVNPSIQTVTLMIVTA